MTTLLTIYIRAKRNLKKPVAKFDIDPVGNMDYPLDGRWVKKNMDYLLDGHNVTGH